MNEAAQAVPEYQAKGVLLFWRLNRLAEKLYGSRLVLARKREDDPFGAGAAVCLPDSNRLSERLQQSLAGRPVLDARPIAHLADYCGGFETGGLESFACKRTV